MRHHLRHATDLKVIGEQCKSHEQAKEIGQQHPFVAQVAHESIDAGARWEARDSNFVQRDHDCAAHRHFQRMRVQQRHAREHGREQ
jgi:hypothetical protein